MTFDIRSTDSIYEQFRDELQQKSGTITNFTTGSFNNAYITAHSEQIRQAELRAIATELGGTVEYAGKDLTEADLRRIGITDVDPAEINQYMYDEQLDYLANNYGIVRSSGERASGTVEFTVLNDSVEIEEGTVVSTTLRSNDDQLDFVVDVDGDGEIASEPRPTVSPDSGETTVTVDVIASEPGSEYNIGSGTITRIPVPEPSIQSVTNPESISGGEDPQDNESLREQVSNALFSSAQGGTVLGIESYIESETANDVDINIEEFLDAKPTYVDVIADGGDAETLRDLIEESRPIGVRHNLVRPNRISFSVGTDVVGDNIDTAYLETTIIQSLSTFDLGDSFSSSVLINDIITSQDAIQSVPALNTYVTSVQNEGFTYDDTQASYTLQDAPLGRVNGTERRVNPDNRQYELFFTDIVDGSESVSAVIDDTRTTLTAGTDYSLVNNTSSTGLDTIELDSSISPDLGTTLEISYEHNSYAVSSVTDTDGTVYEQGVDYRLSDEDGDGLIDSIEWLTDGATPAVGERFGVEYTPARSFEGDRFADERELFGAGRVSITTIGS